MKYTHQTIIISLLFLFISLFIVSTATSEPTTVEFFPSDFNEVKIIEAPDGYVFSSIELAGYSCIQMPCDMPDFTFSTTDEGFTTDANEPVYYSQYYYEILEKGQSEELHIFAPSVYYQDDYEIQTEYLEFEINIVGDEDSGDTFSPMDYEYLIITTDALLDTFNNNFKSWKISTDSKISDMLIVSVSDISSWSYCWVNGTYGDATNNSGGNHWVNDGEEITSNYEMFNDTQAKIRNHIRYCYDNYGTRYVLLAGNKDLLPPRMMCTYAHSGPSGQWYNDTSHACDMYYSCLHGNFNNNTNSRWGENRLDFYWVQTPEWDWIDWGYDAIVGRVLINSVVEADRWITKTKNYVDATNRGYLMNGMVASKDSGNNIDDYVWSQIGDEFSDDISFVNGQNISQAQWNIADDYCNGDVGGWDGIALIHHSGHGGTFWSPYQPGNLDNSDVPNFLVTEGCHSGDFGTDTSSRAEQWIEDDGGLYGGIINSAYGWFIASTWYGEEMFNQMFNETTGINEKVFAEAHNDAREIVGHTLHSVAPMIVKETNYFGDPALEFNFWENQLPTLSDENPINGSTGQNISLDWNITCYDPDGDYFNITLECSSGNITWYSYVLGGNYVFQPMLSGLEYETTYTVWVNASECFEGTWIREWFTFTTMENDAPVFSNEDPINGSAGQDIYLLWSITVNDPEGDLFDITIDCPDAISGGWYAGNGMPNNTYNVLIGGDYATTYIVYVNVTDGIGWTREWFIFTTMEKPNEAPEFSNEDPANNSINHPLLFIWNITVDDPDDDNFELNISCNNSQWAYWDNTSDGVHGLSLSGLNNNTWYTITVWANDSNNNGTREEWFTFRTKPEIYQPSDINEDGYVNYLDVSALVSHYGETGPPGWIPEDINDDGIVNYLDISLLISHYGESY